MKREELEPRLLPLFLKAKHAYEERGERLYALQLLTEVVRQAPQFTEGHELLRRILQGENR